MSRVSFASDIHLGFYKTKQLPAFSWHPEFSVLLFAGDDLDGVTPEFIDWILETSIGRRCLMTIGNYEFYGSRRDKAIRELHSGFRGTQCS